MDCFQDFCLFCDRESLDGLYCSQACKLADLERSTTSAASSPMASSSPRWATTSSPALPHTHHAHSHSHSHSHSHVHALPPTDRKSSTSSSSSSATYAYATPSSSYARHYPAAASSLPHHDAAVADRLLTPSSSRTSLSSTLSSSASAMMTPDGGLSAQAQYHLHDYFSSFDQVRAAKRRSSTR